MSIPNALLSVAAAAIAFSPAQALLDPAGKEAAPSPEWQWSGKVAAGQRFKLNLVRASVRVVRRTGPARLEISATHGSLSSVAFEVEETPQGIEVTDIYHPGPPDYRLPWRSCLPPSGPRGAFWLSDVRMSATLYLPQSVVPVIDVMSER